MALFPMRARRQLANGQPAHPPFRASSAVQHRIGPPERSSPELSPGMERGVKREIGKVSWTLPAGGSPWARRSRTANLNASGHQHSRGSDAPLSQNPPVFGAIRAGDADRLRELVAADPNVATHRNDAGVSAVLFAQ